jgi:hypothetical protein
MVGPAAGPLEQPPSANNANISPTASARTGALLLILITIVRIIGFMMLIAGNSSSDFKRLAAAAVPQELPVCCGPSRPPSSRRWGLQRAPYKPCRLAWV